MILKRVFGFLLVIVASVLAPRPSLAADPADLDALRRLEASFALSPCTEQAAVQLLRIHALRDFVGDERTRTALVSSRAAGRRCPAVVELVDELLARLDRRAGRWDEAMKSYEARGFLRDFLVAGPFGNDSGAGFEATLEPERLASGSRLANDLPMNGRDGTTDFRPLPRAAHAFGYNNLAALWDDPSDSCGVAVATLVSDRGGAAVLRVGASGACGVWWNGEPVVRDPGQRRAFADRTMVKVEVRAGANRVLVKACAESQPELGFYLRITDGGGRPWPWTVDHAAPLAPARPRQSRTATAIGFGDELLRRADAAPRNAQAASLAAWALLLTDTDDRKQHRARDLAKRACELEPSAEHCAPLSRLSLDRSERLWAAERAAIAEPTAETLGELARLELEAGHVDDAQSAVLAGRRTAKANLKLQLLELDLLAQLGLVHAALAGAHRLWTSHPDVPAVALSGWSLASHATVPVSAFIWAERAAGAAADELSPRLHLARRAAMIGDLSTFTRWADDLMRQDAASLSTRGAMARLYLGLGEKATALRMLEEAVADAPGSFPARVERARLLASVGELDRAREELRLAQTLRPQDANVQEYLALYGSGDKGRADYAVPPEVFLAWRGTATNGGDARLLVDQTIVELQPTGLARRYRQIAVEILGGAAMQDWREHWISSSATDQRVEILTARVLRADGSIATGSPTATVPVSEPWYRLYYDVEAQGIELPNLAPGDVVEIAYRIDDIGSRNALGDYYGDLCLIEETLPKVLWRYTIKTPASRPLYFNEPAVPGLTRRDERDDQANTTVFEAKNVAAIRPESGMPGPTSVQRYLHVSTYPDYASLWRWYSALVAPAAVVDDRIREAVRAAVGKRKEPRAKVAAIHRWVVTNTRYVGLEFGIHGYKPYAAPLVVSRGFGDCKDKANLLVTMLKEAGVDAELALVRTRHGGDLDTGVASLSAFDHAIAYVPSLNLWLDGTAEQHGFEDLPFADQGVLALRLSPRGPTVAHTPVLPAQRNRTSGELTLWLSASGDARLTAEVSTTGETAAHLRRELETEHTRHERFEQLLQGSLPGAALSFLHIDSLEALDAPVSYSYEATLTGYAKTGADQLLEVPVDQGQDMVKRFARLPTRATTLITGPTGVIERRTVLHLPEGYRVSSLPETVRLATRFGSLELDVRADGPSLLISRKVALDVAEVGASDYGAFVEFCRAVDEALARRITLRRTP